MNNKFNQSTPQVQPQQPSYADRSFLHSIVVAVGVPLLQAVVTGIFAMILTAAMIYVFDGERYIGPMLVVGSLVSVFMWVFLQFNWLKLTTIEKVTGIDLNGDGRIGEPPKKVTITINKVKENSHVEQMQYTFPVSDQQIARFFTTVKTSTRGGKGIARRQWTPKNVHGFSEGEWDAFYAELVHQRLVTVKGNECILTPDGEEIADGWYLRETPPSPTDEDA